MYIGLCCHICCVVTTSHDSYVVALVLGGVTVWLLKLPNPQNVEVVVQIKYRSCFASLWLLVTIIWKHRRNNEERRCHWVIVDVTIISFHDVLTL